MKPLIYLACPFRHPNFKEEKRRCAAVHYVAAKLFGQGHHVFSPLTHNEILIDLMPNIPGEHWMQFDLTIMAACSKLMVVKMPGWEESKGVAKEIAFAKERDMPIEYIEPPTDEQIAFALREPLASIPANLSQ